MVNILHIADYNTCCNT